MRTAIARALLFSGCTLAATLAIDLVLSFLYGTGPAAGPTRPFLVFRAALHGATFVLTALGAAVGFARLGAARIRVANAHIGMLGGGFGAFALAATLTGVRLGGFAAIALVLVAGAAAVSFFGAKAIALADDGR